MISASTVDAVNRIAERAADVLRSYTPGGSGAKSDVNIAARPPERSSDPLSVAAPPQAYFVVQSANGSRSYTRDGSFVLDGGALRGSDGASVLGYPGGEAPGFAPVALKLPRGDVALGRCSSVRIESDGTVAYTRSAIDPRTSERSVERVALGKIALARFPVGTQPLRLDERHVGAPPGIVPHLGTPGDGSFAGIATYSRDTGSVDIDTSLDKLAEAYRALSALAAANHAHGKTDQTAMDLLK